MARTKIKTHGQYTAYADCPKVMLKAYLEKQKWFIAALSVAKMNQDKAQWESRCTQPSGAFYGSDPYELKIQMMAEGETVQISVKMNVNQGFEICMGHLQEQRRGDGSLIIWYSNNIEGAAERVKRHYEQHGVPWAEQEKERSKKKKEAEQRQRDDKLEFESKVGGTFAVEKWNNNLLFEQGSFGLSFRYEEVFDYDDGHRTFVGQKMVKLKSIDAYFTTEEFKEFLEFIATRPRLVAERLKGQVSTLNPGK